MLANVREEERPPKQDLRIISTPRNADMIFWHWETPSAVLPKPNLKEVDAEGTCVRAERLMAGKGSSVRRTGAAAMISRGWRRAE